MRVYGSYLARPVTSNISSRWSTQVRQCLDHGVRFVANLRGCGGAPRVLIVFWSLEGSTLKVFLLTTSSCCVGLIA